MPSEEELKRARDEEREDGFGIVPGAEAVNWEEWLDVSSDRHGYSTTLLESGYVLRHHPKENCSGGCCLHGTSSYVSCRMPRQWRSDHGILEHVCHHGIGHPCRAGREYATITGQHHDDGAHRCDGCCREDWDIPISSVVVEDTDDGGDSIEDRLLKVEYAGYALDGRLDGIVQRLKWAEEDLVSIEASLSRRVTIIAWLLLATIAAGGILIYLAK